MMQVEEQVSAITITNRQAPGLFIRPKKFLDGLTWF
jgi:hypothetical protein